MSLDKIFEVGEKYTTEDCRIFICVVASQFTPDIFRQGWREELPEQPKEPEPPRTFQQIQAARFTSDVLGVPFDITPEETYVLSLEANLPPIVDGKKWQPKLNLTAGTIVTENGKNFIVREGKGHISQRGWNPKYTPALFEQIKQPYAQWTQPTGSHDAYMSGDRVTHNDQIWVSRIDNNVWEPGAPGTEGLWEIAS